MTVKCVTEEQKQQIFEDYEDGKSKTFLSRDYGVSTRTIGRIIEEKREELQNELNSTTGFDMTEEEFEDYLDECSEIVDYALQQETTPAEEKEETPSIKCKYSFVMTPDSLSITLVSDDEYGTVNIDSDHENFQEAYDKLLSDPKCQFNLAEIYSMLNIKYNIENYTEGKVTVLAEEGRIVYNDDDGNPVGQFNGKLVSRILDSISNNQPIQNLMKFADKLTENPSFRAVQELYEFLEACDIEINEDGDVVCFKRVREDYKDIYSGNFDNSPGQTLSVPRNLVDEDSERTCSYGLHVCSKSYLSSYPGAKVLRVIVHPKDFVAIPKDYYNGTKAKARTCGYYVEADITDNY